MAEVVLAEESLTRLCSNTKSTMEPLPAFMHTDHISDKKQKKFSEKKKKGFMDGLHTPPLKKVKKTREMPLPSLGPIPLKKM